MEVRGRRASDCRGVWTQQGSSPASGIEQLSGRPATTSTAAEAASALPKHTTASQGKLPRPARGRSWPQPSSPSSYKAHPSHL